MHKPVIPAREAEVGGFQVCGQDGVPSKTLYKRKVLGFPLTGEEIEDGQSEAPKLV